MKIVSAYIGLLASLLIACPAVSQDSFNTPPEDGYDWIQLTSGEWLRGKLDNLFEDELEFDSDILDDLVIDWEDVARVISPRRFGVSIQGRGPVSGVVSIDEANIQITIAGQEYKYPREQLVSLTISAEREWDRWSGEFSIGTNVRKGNTDIVEYNSIANLERRTPLSRLVFDYIGNYNKTEDVEVSNNHRIGGTYDRFTASRLFWRPLNGQFFRDPFQNIDYQFSLETGLGYELINNRRTTWDVYTSAGINTTQRVSVEDLENSRTESPSVSLGTDFEIELTSWMDYILSYRMSFLDEASGSFQHHLLTTISTDLVWNLDFDVSFVWDRVQKPPSNAEGETPERDDYRLIIGISYDF